MKTKDQVAPKLYEFLSKKKVLTKFMKNAKSKKANGILCGTSKDTIIDDISSAFLWYETKEGFTFWEKLELEFYS
jgi:hypothetical protein